MATHEVWKFQFPLTPVADHEYEHLIPYGSTVVHYALQNGTPTVWYEVNPKSPKTIHTFRIVMTGEPFEIDEYTRDQHHVGTFMLDWLVVHLYDLTPFEKFDVKDFVYSVAEQVGAAR